MATRRAFLARAGVAAAAAGLTGSSWMLQALARTRPTGSSAKPVFGTAFRGSLERLETASRGRLGLAVFDSGTGERFAYRGNERFAMCSTFKFLLATAVLARVDAGTLALALRVPVRKEDLIPYAPFTQARVGADASIAELCESTLTLSDNVAANLLLPLVDGPAGLTAWLRGRGDPLTRLDRNEPGLNTAIPGDPRDTTTPEAMVGRLQDALLGAALSAASRTQLTAWLVANQTGGPRLRAGFPDGWKVGDKTGSGNGTTNDLAIVWRGDRAPLLVACYLTASPLDGDARDRIVAGVGRAIAAVG